MVTSSLSKEIRCVGLPISVTCIARRGEKEQTPSDSIYLGDGYYKISVHLPNDNLEGVLEPIKIKLELIIYQNPYLCHIIVVLCHLFNYWMTINQRK